MRMCTFWQSAPRHLQLLPARLLLPAASAPHRHPWRHASACWGRRPVSPVRGRRPCCRVCLLGGAAPDCDAGRHCRQGLCQLLGCERVRVRGRDVCGCGCPRAAFRVQPTKLNQPAGLSCRHLTPSTCAASREHPAWTSAVDSSSCESTRSSCQSTCCCAFLSCGGHHPAPHDGGASPAGGCRCGFCDAPCALPGALQTQ